MSPLNKPKFLEPCNGCGLCCQLEVCALGLDMLGNNTPAPCPLIRARDGRFFCGAVDMADEMGAEQGAAIRFILGVGIGCDAEIEDEDAKTGA